MNRAFLEGFCRGIAFLANTLLITDCSISLYKRRKEAKAAKAEAKAPEAKAETAA